MTKNFRVYTNGIMLKKNRIIVVRASVKEKNRIKILAKFYAGGNVSQWMIYSAINAPRKFLVKTDLGPLSRNKKARLKKNRAL